MITGRVDYRRATLILCFVREQIGKLSLLVVRDVFNHYKHNDYFDFARWG